MARAAKKPCCHPGCGALVDSGYCSNHKQIRDHGRSDHSKLYTTPEFRSARRVFLSQYQWCVDCERDGIKTLATVVDHVIPHKGDYDLFWDRSNWQPRCVRHHNRKTARHDGGFGNPIK